MIQVHSCNLLYSSMVMADGLFKRVSVLKKAYVLLSAVLLVCFLFIFAIFETG